MSTRSRAPSASATCSARPGADANGVAFANEESPYFATEQMGSWVYAKRCHDRRERVRELATG